jgi:hypothetical protein
MTSDADQYIRDIIALHRAAHRQLREEIQGLDTAALNWTPGPEFSSIGVIVTHALGAEAEMLRNLLTIPTQRDRNSEFTAQVHQLNDLEKLIDNAETDWRTLAPRIEESELRAQIPRPNKPIPQSGFFWLMRNYGHLREHIAQIQMTKQLYQTRAS